MYCDYILLVKTQYRYKKGVGGQGGLQFGYIKLSGNNSKTSAPAGRLVMKQRAPSWWGIIASTGRKCRQQSSWWRARPETWEGWGDQRSRIIWGFLCKKHLVHTPPCRSHIPTESRLSGFPGHMRFHSFFPHLLCVFRHLWFDHPRL